MKNPPIDVITPTSSSFKRMQTILFQPFDMGKWFLLGFSAWLAALFGGQGSNFGANFGGPVGDDSSGNGKDFYSENLSSTLKEWFSTTKQWIVDNPELTVAISFGILLLITVILLVFWVSCRGKFMFLNNVVRNQTEIVNPWKTFKKHGNSLFRWSLVYGCVVMIMFLFTMAGIGSFALSIHDNGGDWDVGAILTVILLGCALLCLSLILAYIMMVLEDFVIPIMYRDNLTTTQAWGRFIKLQNQHIIHFFVYALWKMVLSFGVSIGVIIIALGTCCVGLILLAIPYIGSVLILPISVFLRCFGPEFLSQFGEDYNLFESN